MSTTSRSHLLLVVVLPGVGLLDTTGALELSISFLTPLTTDTGGIVRSTNDGRDKTISLVVFDMTCYGLRGTFTFLGLVYASTREKN